MDKEQILALAVQTGFKLDWAISNCTGQFESFYHAAIESYKAELLKEVGEPVGTFWYETEDDGHCHEWGISVRTGAKIENGDNLFTSDQLAAAILKATKPLEDEVERLVRAGEKLLEEKHKAQRSEREVWDQNNELRVQLSSAEQRVAEACALTYLEDYDLTDIAERVRAGEYRKFMKGE